MQSVSFYESVVGILFFVCELVWCLLQFFAIMSNFYISTHVPRRTYITFFNVWVHCTGFYVMFLITQPDEWRLVLFNYTNTCKSARCDGNAMRLYQRLLHFALAGIMITHPFICAASVLFDTLRMSSICCNTCTTLYIIYFVYVWNDPLLRVRILWWVNGCVWVPRDVVCVQTLHSDI